MRKEIEGCSYIPLLVLSVRVLLCTVRSKLARGQGTAPPIYVHRTNNNYKWKYVSVLVPGGIVARVQSNRPSGSRPSEADAQFAHSPIAVGRLLTSWDYVIRLLPSLKLLDVYFGTYLARADSSNSFTCRLSLPGVLLPSKSSRSLIFSVVRKVARSLSKLCWKAFGRSHLSF